MGLLQTHIARATEIYEEVMKSDRDLRVHPRLLRSKVVPLPRIVSHIRHNLSHVPLLSAVHSSFAIFFGWSLSIRSSIFPPLPFNFLYFFRLCLSVGHFCSLRWLNGGVFFFTEARGFAIVRRGRD